MSKINKIKITVELEEIDSRPTPKYKLVREKDGLTKQSEEAPTEVEFVDSDNQSMISLNQYQDLKEYWDFQRKIEYNREKCQLACESVIVVQDDLPMDSSDFFEMIWSKMDQEDYEDPPKNWVPKNPDYRIEGEIYFAQIKFYSINTV